MIQIYKTRKLDSRGRLTIPAEIRQVLKIDKANELEIFMENEIICIKLHTDVTQK